MDDKSWNDYLTGLNTGVAFGPMGELGKSHRWEPAPPPQMPVEQRRSTDLAGTYQRGPQLSQSPPIRPSRAKAGTWWDALRQCEMHVFLVEKGRKLLDPIAESRVFRIGLCLLVLGSGLYGYFGIDNQANPWFGAIMVAMLALAAPFVAGIAIVATLYTVGLVLSIAVVLAIVSFWIGIVGGAVFLGFVLVGVFLGS